MVRSIFLPNRFSQWNNPKYEQNNHRGMPTFDGIDFTGPMEISELPHGPGVYIVTTYASGGVKILGAYEGDDMNLSAEKNPKRDCWIKNRKDTDPVAYCLNETDPDKRISIVYNIMQRRFYGLVCNDPIRDEF